MSKKLNILQEKVNMLYVAISILVVVAIGALIGSCWMPESYNDVKNIVVGLSTGIITSALVTVYIENINARMDKKRKVRYKQMLLNPLYMSIDRLYKRLILNINEYVDQHIIIWHFRRIKLCRNNAGIFHPRTPGILVITVIEKIITVITRLKMGYFNFPDSANYGIK